MALAADLGLPGQAADLPLVSAAGCMAGGASGTIFLLAQSDSLKPLGGDQAAPRPWPAPWKTPGAGIIYNPVGWPWQLGRAGIVALIAADPGELLSADIGRPKRGSATHHLGGRAERVGPCTLVISSCDPHYTASAAPTMKPGSAPRCQYPSE